MPEPYKTVPLRSSVYRRLLSYVGRLQEHSDSRVSINEAVSNLMDVAETTRRQDLS